MSENWFSDDKATLGDRIEAAREVAGISTRDLAERLGIRHKTLISWENDTAEPRANRVQMLSGMLGVSLVWLLTGQGEGPGESSARAAGELRELRATLEAALDRVARLEKALAQ